MSAQPPVNSKVKAEQKAKATGQTELQNQQTQVQQQQDRARTADTTNGRSYSGDFGGGRITFDRFGNRIVDNSYRFDNTKANRDILTKEKIDFSPSGQLLSVPTDSVRGYVSTGSSDPNIKSDKTISSDVFANASTPTKTINIKNPKPSPEPDKNGWIWAEKRTGKPQLTRDSTTELFVKSEEATRASKYYPNYENKDYERGGTVEPLFKLPPDLQGKSFGWNSPFVRGRVAKPQLERGTQQEQEALGQTTIEVFTPIKSTPSTKSNVAPSSILQPVAAKPSNQVSDTQFREDLTNASKEGGVLEIFSNGKLIGTTSGARSYHDFIGFEKANPNAQLSYLIVYPQKEKALTEAVKQNPSAFSSLPQSFWNNLNREGYLSDRNFNDITKSLNIGYEVQSRQALGEYYGESSNYLLTASGSGETASFLRFPLSGTTLFGYVNKQGKVEKETLPGGIKSSTSFIPSTSFTNILQFAPGLPVFGKYLTPYEGWWLNAIDKTGGKVGSSFNKLKIDIANRALTESLPNFGNKLKPSQIREQEAKTISLKQPEEEVYFNPSGKSKVFDQNTFLRNTQKNYPDYLNKKEAKTVAESPKSYGNVWIENLTPKAPVTEKGPVKASSGPESVFNVGTFYTPKSTPLPKEFQDVIIGVRSEKKLPPPKPSTSRVGSPTVAPVQITTNPEIFVGGKPQGQYFYQGIFPEGYLPPGSIASTGYNPAEIDPFYSNYPPMSRLGPNLETEYASKVPQRKINKESLLGLGETPKESVSASQVLFSGKNLFKENQQLFLSGLSKNLLNFEEKPVKTKEGSEVYFNSRNGIDQNTFLRNSEKNYPDYLNKRFHKNVSESKKIFEFSFTSEAQGPKAIERPSDVMGKFLYTGKTPIAKYSVSFSQPIIDVKEFVGQSGSKVAKTGKLYGGISPLERYNLVGQQGLREGDISGINKETGTFKRVFYTKPEVTGRTGPSDIFSGTSITGKSYFPNAKGGRFYTSSEVYLFGKSFPRGSLTTKDVGTSRFTEFQEKNPPPEPKEVKGGIYDLDAKLKSIGFGTYKKAAVYQSRSRLDKDIGLIGLSKEGRPVKPKPKESKKSEGFVNTGKGASTILINEKPLVKRKLFQQTSQDWNYEYEAKPVPETKTNSVLVTGTSTGLLTGIRFKPLSDTKKGLGNLLNLKTFSSSKTGPKSGVKSSTKLVPDLSFKLGPMLGTKQTPKQGTRTSQKNPTPQVPRPKLRQPQIQPFKNPTPQTLKLIPPKPPRRKPAFDTNFGGIRSGKKKSTKEGPTAIIGLSVVNVFATGLNIKAGKKWQF